MMDMSMIDIGTVLAVLGLFYKLSADKAAHAEEMGKLKQQVRSLESRAGKIDDRLESIDDKLANLINAITRLETIIGQNQQ
jgi:predicted  nucleic acid-binding Zn-ribbon protein